METAPGGKQNESPVASSCPWDLKQPAEWERGCCSLRAGQDYSNSDTGTMQGIFLFVSYKITADAVGIILVFLMECLFVNIGEIQP